MKEEEIKKEIVKLKNKPISPKGSFYSESREIKEGIIKLEAKLEQLQEDNQKFQDALKKLEEVGEVVNICVSSNEEYKAMQIKLKDWNKLKNKIK